jgi:hypothetical protein
MRRMAEIARLKMLELLYAFARGRHDVSDFRFEIRRRRSDGAA